MTNMKVENHPCPDCNGHGRVESYVPGGFCQMIVSEVECQRCRGKGIVRGIFVKISEHTTGTPEPSA